MGLLGALQDTPQEFRPRDGSSARAAEPQQSCNQSRHLIIITSLFLLLHFIINKFFFILLFFHYFWIHQFRTGRKEEDLMIPDDIMMMNEGIINSS